MNEFDIILLNINSSKERMSKNFINVAYSTKPLFPVLIQQLLDNILSTRTDSDSVLGWIRKVHWALLYQEIHSVLILVEEWWNSY